MWGQKLSKNRYNKLNDWLKDKYGEKVFKVSLDAGFTCPNRDGTVSRDGCIFCSEKGSGDFAASGSDLKEQFHAGKTMMEKKWKKGFYIVYFQSFTNTYAPIDRLREIYYSLLEEPGVIGIAIATRPDCLGEEVLDLLSELSKKTFLWVELGLQTMHNKTGKTINRGYDTDVYNKAVSELKKRNILVVTHIILGLPDESREEMLQTVDFVSKSGVWGIKLHMLHVLRDTKLEEIYKSGGLKVFEQDEYVSLVVDALERIPADIVIHRVTGDGARDSLVAPLWSLKKFEVLNAIDDEFVKRSSCQGALAKTGRL